MASIKMEHTADSGRELVYRVRVYEDEFYWLSTDELAEHIVSQFKDYVFLALEDYDAELKAQ